MGVTGLGFLDFFILLRNAKPMVARRSHRTKCPFLWNDEICVNLVIMHELHYNESRYLIINIIRK